MLFDAKSHQRVITNAEIREQHALLVDTIAKSQNMTMQQSAPKADIIPPNLKEFEHLFKEENYWNTLNGIMRSI